jgi:KUP system potassium uptake protein
MAMLVTTVLLGEVARRRWWWGIPMTFGVIGAFFVVDLAFFSANTLKIIEGGWFPLLVGAVVFILMSTWRRGRQLLLDRTSEDNPPQKFIAELDPSQMPRVDGTAVYLASRRDTLPYAMTDNLRHNKALLREKASSWWVNREPRSAAKRAACSGLVTPRF